MKTQPKNNYKRQMEHAERIRLKRDKIEGLRALMATWETMGYPLQARRIGTKIRLAEQELRYMGANEDEINLIGSTL
jgi:hypothetical protein